MPSPDISRSSHTRRPTGVLLTTRTLGEFTMDRGYGDVGHSASWKFRTLSLALRD